MTKRFSCAVLLAFVVPSVSFANEIDGFRLGMTVDQVRRLATEKRYSFSNPIKGDSSNWTAYILMNDGPAVSFCGDTLSAVDKTYTSNLHEFTSLLGQWTSAMGFPQAETSQFYVQGRQRSGITYKWVGNDNIRRTMSFAQLGENSPQISYGFSLIDNPCRAPS